MIASILQSIFDYLEELFDLITGDFDPYILFSWCPQDIQNAVELLIIILFCLALARFIKSFLPF